MNKPFKVLITPEISGFGSGTFSFLVRLIEIHQNNNIISCVLLEKKYATAEMISYLKNQGAIVYISFFNRPHFFYKPIVSLLFDLLYISPFYLKCKPDLIHISCGAPGIFLSALLFPGSVLHTLHTVPLGKLRWGMSFFLKNILANKQKHLSTVSIYSQKAIADCFGVEPMHIRVIYNSVKNNNDSANILRDGSPNKKTIILTLGHVVDYKNPHGWLTVANSIIAMRPHVRFIWAGEGELRKYLTSIVKEKNLTERIQFIGYQQETTKLYKNATIYFQPSILESHGISVVDAMSFGLPCVVSDAGGLPESVIDGVTGYVCPKIKTETYIVKLLQLIDNPSNAIAMGKKGRERAMQLFSQSTQESKYLELYSELTGTSLNV